MSALKAERKWIQWLTSLTATLSLCCCGMLFSWPSPALEKLHSEGLFHLTKEEISWAVSLLSVGAIFGSVFNGLIIDTIGRKWCILATNGPFIIGWVLIFFSESAPWLYAANIVAGTGVGMAQCAVPIYVGEIASTDLRGALGTLSSVMINLGVLLEFVCGPFVTFRALAAISCVVPMVSVVCMLFVPESPTFLLAKNREEEGRAALHLLRGQCSDEDIAAIKEDMRKDTSLAWYRAINSGAAKPLVIVGFLGFFQQVSGNAVLQAYFDEIYLATNNSLKPVVADVIVSVITVFAALVSAWTVEKSGRRPLFHISSALEVLGYFLLGGFFYFENYENSPFKKVSWLPLVLIATILASFNVGHGPLVYVLVGEILPHEVRAAGSTFTVLCISMGAFFSTKLYPLIEPYTAFWLFGGFVFVSAVFFFIMVPETKGKTLEEIRQLFGNNTKICKGSLKI